MLRSLVRFQLAPQFCFTGQPGPDRREVDNLEAGTAGGRVERHMSMLDHRLQVLIDEDRWARQEREAKRRGVPMATLVREAIDERFPALAEERRAALQAVLDAEPMDVPEPAELRQELDSIRTRRLA